MNYECCVCGNVWGTNMDSPECPQCHSTFIKEIDLKAKLGINPKQLLGNNKIPSSTVSQLVMMEVGVAMLEGALKYGRHNYRANEGIVASVYYDATCRHLDTWYEGEDDDPDTRISHLSKAIASITVLRDAMLLGTFIDDRPPRINNLALFRKELEERVKEMRVKHNPPAKPITEVEHGDVKI